MAFKTPPTIEQFAQTLFESELMSESELAAFTELLAQQGKHPESAAQLAYELVHREHLTKYQAQVLYQGRKSRPLVLGNYVVLERLGAGGMGQVFKAKHRVMERVVALKVLPIGHKEDAVKRFHREVKAAARLVHPNIVTAYDADFAKGCHFLVMEYVDGMNLSQFVKENGPFPPDQAAACVVQAARGLAYAHSMGVIHRDIKPSNLLLDSHGIVKILDMGLARIEETMELDAQADELTQAGSVMGSVDYMSPEQGFDMRNTNQLSDIYSLGGTLYWLLIGHPMYSGKTVVERILAHRDRPIPPIRETNPDCPVRLDQFFQRMVAKDPAQRPQSMDEVIAGIEEIFLMPNESGVEGDSPRMEETISISTHAIQEETPPHPATPDPGTITSVSNSLLDEWIMDDVSSTSQAHLVTPPLRLGGYRRRERQLYWLVGLVAVIAATVIIGTLLYDLVQSLNDMSAANSAPIVTPSESESDVAAGAATDTEPTAVILSSIKIQISEPDATLRIVNAVSGEKISEQKLFGRKDFEMSLPLGKYRIEVEKSGFSPTSQEVELTSAEATSVEMSLTAAP